MQKLFKWIRCKLFHEGFDFVVTRNHEGCWVVKMCHVCRRTWEERC